MPVHACSLSLAPCSASPTLRPLPQAITTLLKTGNESSIDRLLKQIGGFMSEIADEFKVVVVEAIKALCLKFPQVRRAGGGGGAGKGPTAHTCEPGCCSKEGWEGCRRTGTWMLSRGSDG